MWKNSDLTTFACCRETLKNDKTNKCMLVDLSEYYFKLRKQMWLPLIPLPLLFSSWRMPLLVYNLRGLCCGISDMVTALHWLLTGPYAITKDLEPEIKAEWTAYTKMELLALTSLTKHSSQQMRGKKYMEEEKVFSFTCCTFKRKNQNPWYPPWKKSESPEHFLCSIKSEPCKKKWDKVIEEQHEFEGMYRANSCFSWMSQMFQSLPLLILCHLLLKIPNSKFHFALHIL